MLTLKMRLSGAKAIVAITRNTPYHEFVELGRIWFEVSSKATPD